MQTDPLFKFDPVKHEYSYGGTQVPSVTQLLQLYGLIDYSKVPKMRLEYKRTLGMAVHYAIELYNHDNLDEDSLDVRIKPHFLAYKKFVEVHRYEPRHTEIRLYSKLWKFAGTMDSQGPLCVNGKEYESIIDWKCTFQHYPSQNIQTAAYEILFNENYPEIKSKKRYNLILKETGNYDLIEAKDPADRNIFLACSTLYHWKKKHNLEETYEHITGN